MTAAGSLELASKGSWTDTQYPYALHFTQPDCEATSQTSSRSDAAAGGHTVHVSAYARHMSNLAGSVFDMGEEGPQVCGPACCLGPACCPRGVIATYFCIHAQLVLDSTRWLDQLTCITFQLVGT